MSYGKFVVDLFRATEVLVPEELKGKKILAVSRSYAGSAVQELFEMIYGFSVDVTGCEITELHNIDTDNFFDIIILVDGLEAVKNFAASIAALKTHCRENGLIFIIARTPADHNADNEYSHYEDYWRYTITDLQQLFSDCRWITAIEDDEQPFIAIKFIKSPPLAENRTDEIAVYNCRWHKKMRNDAKYLSAGFFNHYQKLDTLGCQYETDKSSLRHHYLDKYEFFLQAFCDKEFVFMELGVFKGSSAKMWKQYFQKAQIVGVDINSDCKKYEEERLHIIIANLADDFSLQQLAKLGASIIVDDASHLWSHQIKALLTLFPSLPSGGIYIMEDLGTSLNRDIWPGYDDAPVSGYDLCSQIAEVVTGKGNLRSPGLYREEIERIGRETEMISFIKGSCILVKR